ncbi:hypothetical protein A3D00_01020 [Candidatus Woesebacteria bacterium RIFCSPHIGHO2_02_FULL_38_9]|uniref:Uncharacterized protein n=1 Tax=Candidatus Woesebacteria bacterium RIFCSPHIGHO2_01_FULL_39_28 TaxID=1802496 RepID=A0A1F7YH41_9BACT|nr:MAG: hypothetical protein A2627_01375 [Candidatus Woesebacteria bacterium RIFCSPHIGHO2_01_FULL_39_28]OGM31706.1 MAG: hypothetical protein A3D00_01020 [Candidatus Woesebacteria bacterium RIFCSPHIGHO2_02_FULL_38_9]OGM57645.1 MAG: hypothetical protein A3A50_01395 [Candidatus Woesebacteria bacterium RIFCSPLOWO2_01_FULL_38_20]
MAKRRTRREKEEAKHKFLVHWEGEGVKRQIPSTNEPEKVNKIVEENTNFSDNITSVRSIKNDIARSLILDLFILALEIVIYLVRS